MSEITFWVKQFDSREAAFIAQRDIGFGDNLYCHNDIYYYASLDETDRFFTGMAELTVQSEDWHQVHEKWNHFKLYRFIWIPPHKLDDIPFDVNYITGLTRRLYPIVSYTRGRITRIDYMLEGWLNALGEKEGNDLAVREDFEYTLNAGGFAVERTQTIRWYLEDGTEGGSKTRHKFYDNKDSREEGRRRRRNVIDILSMDVVGILAATHTSGDIPSAVAIGIAYMGALEAETIDFIETSSNALRDAITGDADTSWLNNVIDVNGTTVRDYIVVALS